MTWTSAQADMFFSTNTGIGLSLLRMQVQPEGFTHANEIALAQMAQTRGARIWATPWTPPASFKDNDNTNGGSFLSADYKSYASLLAGYVANLTNSHINLYALSIQNEPNAVVSYVSCYWSPQQFHDFVPYLSKALIASNASSTKIMLPETENWDGTNFETIAMNDPKVAAQVGILAHHNYDGIGFDSGPTFDPRRAHHVRKAVMGDGGLHGRHVRRQHFKRDLLGGADTSVYDSGASQCLALLVVDSLGRHGQPGADGCQWHPSKADVCPRTIQPVCPTEL